MNTMPNRSPYGGRLNSFVLAVFTGVLLDAGIALAQSDDFNDGNDAGWSHLDLGSVGLNGATYSFPADGAGGKAYRIHASAPLVDFGLPALALTFRAPPPYTRFQIGVDILNWDQAPDQAYGIFARASEVTDLTSIDGYVMNFNTSDGALQINEITDLGGQDTIAESPTFLAPGGGPYRWVFTGYGTNFLGQVFKLAETNNPMYSVVAVAGPNQVGYASGPCGLFVFNRSDPPLDDVSKYADATFDNYDASAPAAGSLGATVVELQPPPHLVAQTVPVPVKVAILDRETTVVANSVVLTVDGVTVPSGSLTLDPQVIVPNNAAPFGGLTITYTNTNVSDLGGVHTNRVTFRDSAGADRTNEWTYTFAYLHGANSAPPGSGKDPGFSVRLVQSINNQPLANSLARAEQQLAVPPQIAIDFTTNTTAPVINYTQNAVPSDPPSADGHFVDYATFPGIDPAGNTDDIAMEVLSYLEFPAAGTYTLGVTSDDGFQLRSGASLTDTNALVLGEKLSGTFDGSFDVIVEKAGLYPFRLVWFERGGGANVELWSMDNGTMKLVNDATSPIKAYLSVVAPSVVLQSSTTLASGSFADEGLAIVDTNAKTVTLPRSGDQRFYRLSSATALHIKSLQFQGQNVVLTYE